MAQASNYLSRRQIYTGGAGLGARPPRSGSRRQRHVGLPRGPRERRGSLARASAKYGSVALPASAARSTARKGRLPIYRASSQG